MPSTSWTLATTAAATATATALAAYAAYHWHTSVPPDTGDLGNLADYAAKRRQKDDDEPLAHPEDFWPVHGYAHLPAGKTHYHLLGPDTGPKLLLIPDPTTPWPATPTFVTSLALNGFRVCAYDLYGHGYSASPGVAYTESLYVDQALGLLDALGWTRAHVLGYGLGGGVATAVAAGWPERVNKVVLIAPAGVARRLPVMGYVMMAPVIGKLLGHTIGRRLLVQVSKKNHDPTLLSTPEMRHFTAVTTLTSLHHPGFMRAHLSTLRHGPITRLDARYRVVGERLGENVLCLWGTEDREGMVGRVKACMPRARVE
ncbi:hypothetical protein HDU96_002052, partial [Phlyctochytrium bullatum]